MSVTDQPADLTALITRRGRPSSSLAKNYDVVQKHLANVQRLVAALPLQLFAAPQRKPSSPREMTPQERIRLARIHERAAARYHASTSQSSFSTMAAELNRRSV